MAIRTAALPYISTHPQDKNMDEGSGDMSDDHEVISPMVELFSMNPHLLQQNKNNGWRSWMKIRAIYPTMVKLSAERLNESPSSTSSLPFSASARPGPAWGRCSAPSRRGCRRCCLSHRRKPPGSRTGARNPSFTQKKKNVRKWHASVRENAFEVR